MNRLGAVSLSQGRAVRRARHRDQRAQTQRPLRILCNTPWFDGRTFAERPVDAIAFSPGGLVATLRLFLLARRCDAVVFNGDERQLLLFSLLKRLVGLKNCRLVSVDIHLAPPRTLRARLRARLVGWMLREADLMICYYKATQRMEHAYGLGASRFVYVPFKVNCLDRVQAVEPSDGGFGLVCGRSDRDYRTFAAAVSGLDVPIVVLTGPDHVTHGSDVSRVPMPPNVTVTADDGSCDTWNEWIARSRFVILPVVADVIKPSGITAYLVSMALGKCVIITDSPATQGLIDDGQAVLVPPNDAGALRDAIARVASDEPYRNRVAAAGKSYARSLGDEDRLAEDILQCVGTLIDPGKDHP